MVAAIRWPDYRPGEVHGPCIEYDCGHNDCDVLRTNIYQDPHCQYCGKSVEHGQVVYLVDLAPVHKECKEAQP